MRDSAALQLSDRVEELGQKVEALTTKVDAIAEALSRLTLSPASNPLQAHGPPQDTARGYPATSAASSVSGVSQSSQYNALAEEIPAVPDFAVALCSRLSAGSLSARQRAERAWEAGWWAKFVLAGRISKPRPSRLCDVPNSIYVVLKASNYQCPLYVQTAGAYRAIVGDFKQDTLSHGFGSQAEATIYCTAAGFSLPSSPYRWTSQQ